MFRKLRFNNALRFNKASNTRSSNKRVKNAQESSPGNVLSADTILGDSGSGNAESEVDLWNLGGLVTELQAEHRLNYPRADLVLIHRAYRIAEQMHRGQNRRSGEPYITHPIAVATILASLGCDTPTVAAGLLHDTVEDTSYSMGRLKADFGKEIQIMVDGVTKLDKIHLGSSAEAETFRKLMVAADKDIRVVVIKLADRLHNMRTVKFKKRASQIRIAKATKDVLIPLADRLGLYVIKRELEDLVLETLEPELYADINTYLHDDKDRNARVGTLLPQVRKALKQFRVSAKLYDRPRHHYSVFREMEKNPGSGPSSPPRIVIVVDGNATDCYAALGAIHQQWHPLASKFRDLIAARKYNLYQSLHTTVTSTDGSPIEFLIRTETMHRVAELGLVSELNGNDDQLTRAAQQLPWLSRLLEWQSEIEDSANFLDSLRCDLADQEINVFLRGQTEPLAILKGATPIDVGYCAHGKRGHRVIAAYVNGDISPLAQPLREGDRVELVHTHESTPYGPSKEWLDSAKTAEARMHINSWFKKPTTSTMPGIPNQKKIKEVNLGRQKLMSALSIHQRGLSSEKPLLGIVSDMGYPDVDSLFLAIATDTIEADTVATKLISSVDRI